ncbi:MAG: site-2 protease family protein [Planctomycetota bacterium]
MGWWVSDIWNGSSNGPVMVVSWIVWVVFSIVLHELAHGWAAIRLGDQTPRWTGHMTWNPLVHMGGFSLVALAVFGIAWGAMPVDESRLRGRHGVALVAAAGPATNLALAIAALLLLVVWLPLASGGLIGSVSVPEPLRTNLTLFLERGALLNIVLMLFNLIPAMPLDGGRIAAEYIRPYREFVRTENGMWISFGIMILFFYFGAGPLFGIAADIVFFVADQGWTLLGYRP